MPYEVGSAVSVRALHVMPDAPPPENELHAHDYRIDVVVARDELDAQGMVCDLDVLNASLRDIAARLEGQDLEAIRPEDADAVTVEVFSRWVHGELTGAVRKGGGERLAVRVYESATEFGGYAAPVS
jgi:6-pyruvoyltetrahydropterin/6-carboxytetrahydropterin synthase